jgi:hypothetical protein
MIHTEEDANEQRLSASKKIRDNLIFGDEFLNSRMGTMSYGVDLKSLDLEYMNHLNSEIKLLTSEDNLGKAFSTSLGISSETGIHKGFDNS